MAPKIILVMRHAEKTGDREDVDLSPAGFARAEKLATFIPATFGDPSHIFAAADSKHSDRPVETVTPLAKVLGKTIHSEFADGEFEALADKLLRDAKYDGQMILVCWHHEKAAKLLHHLGAPDGSYPDPWPDDLFDLIVRLDYVGDTPSVTRITEPF